MSERTAVYRIFAADDTLLYVGVAKRFGRRWDQHAKAQPWWGYVDHQTVYWFPCREDALLVEKRAIEDERPVYNIAGSPWVGGVKDDGTGFYVEPKPRRVRPVSTANAPGDRHRYRAITPRLDPVLHQNVVSAVADAGTNMTAVVVDLLRWYTRETDELPQRPPRRD